MAVGWSGIGWGLGKDETVHVIWEDVACGDQKHKVYPFDEVKSQDICRRIGEMVETHLGRIHLSPDLTHTITTGYPEYIVPMRFGRPCVCDPDLPPNSILIELELDS